MGTGTYSKADIYGGADFTPRETEKRASAASGKFEMDIANGPAWSWLTMIGLLVALRILYDLAPVSGK